MPPPSMPVRRSQRVRHPSASPSLDSLQMTPIKFDPVTHMCGTTGSKHFGLGCGAISANHMPGYYSSLAKVCSTSQYCNAYFILRESIGVLIVLHFVYIVKRMEIRHFRDAVQKAGLTYAIDIMIFSSEYQNYWQYSTTEIAPALVFVTSLCAKAWIITTHWHLDT